VFNSAYRPARSRAAVLLATAALLGAAAPAQAAEGDRDEEGTASAAVLRTGLTVSLLNSAVEEPLDVTLNEVTAPSPQGSSAEETLLTARLDGVEGGEPFEMLRADVASAEAAADADGSRAEVTLAQATVHLPGLPLLSLIEAETVTASAVCDAGAAPVADADLGGTVHVLGENVTLGADGSTTVEVPGVGQATLDLSVTETTDTTAAAAALKLSVAVDPLDLGVAAVDGQVTLAEAECESPGPYGEDDPGADEPADEGPGTQTGEDGGAAEPVAEEAADPDLAATGGNSATPYLAGGAVALLAAGGVTLFYVRRRAAGTGDAAGS
jgi:LPXTG-motif cell wall-anchored protein